MNLPDEIEHIGIDELLPYARNSRTHDDAQVAAIAASIKEFGFTNPVLIREDSSIIAGHGRVMAARKLGLAIVPCIRLPHLTPTQVRAYIIADNRLAEMAGWDTEMLAAEIAELRLEDYDIALTGFDDESLRDLLGTIGDGDDAPPGDGETAGKSNLSDRFMIAPFSVLNAREGWWQDRKRAWIALGIRSEEGRGDDALKFSEACKAGYAKAFGTAGNASELSGTSIFDPVLCEIAYRWFSPPGGLILDPFAGGSVRGIVAAMLGRQYVGHELRAEQVEANRVQAAAICADGVGVESVTDPDELTPVQDFGGVWAKRDDAFVVNGVRGGKVRTCLALSRGADGLITAGSRASPQVNIVAHIAQHLGVPCRVHTPQGELSPEVQAAQAAGAEVIQHKAGYNSVIIARAREDAAEQGWVDIPFGMECDEAIKQTRRQVANIPPGVKRIVMPAGSGMSLSGVLWGLKDIGRQLPVLAVVVGADPTERLNQYAPKGWKEWVTLVPSGSDYHDPAMQNVWNGVRLDPHYEAKCAPFVEHGDIFWVVGIRQTEADKPRQGCGLLPQWICGDSRLIDQTCADIDADMVFSCPPYADLEVYSDDPADLSTLPYAEFLKGYREIIAKACARLKPNRFAAFVVGEVRDKKSKAGGYLDFVGDTVQAFRDAGLEYYNEAILVTAVGSLPIRVGKQFVASRKFGKTHQNILVFVKGDPKVAAIECGAVEVDESMLAQPEGEADAQE